MRRFSTTLALLLLWPLACTGVIATPPPVPPVEPPPPPEPQCEHALLPGRSPLHRLTRLEYDQTVRSVLGDTSAPSQTFPADPSHEGFDNVSDVQTVSLLHAEKYEEAAWQLAASLWAREYDPGLLKRFELETRSTDGGYEVVIQTCCGDNSYNNVVANGARGFWTAYRVYVQTALDLEADYTVKWAGWEERWDGGVVTEDGGARPLSWVLQLDSRFPFATVPVAGTRAAPQQHQATVHVDSPGVHQIDISLDDPTRVSYPPYLPVAWADWLSIERAPTTVPVAQQKVRQCDLSAGAACVETTLRALLRQAYRRPPADAEVARVLQVFTAARDDGDGLKDAFSAAVVTVLLSPHFLYRVELDADLQATVAHPLSAHELAAKLSYFLTAAPPDAPLAQAADDGTLLSAQVLQSHADRLWSSAGNALMVQHVGSQLMSTNALENIAPSPTFFPGFDAPLRTAMGQEAELLFGAVAKEDRPVHELIDAPFTFLNDRLAAHYGLPLPGSAALQRVTLASDQRGGALGLGNLLALNSTPARPSQVLRGKWVLTNLLCDEPAAPPAFIPPLGDTPGKTQREILEEHAKNPFCAGCHKRMDPIGFALDHYDADGSFRATDRQGHAIDATGQLPDGTAFDGFAQLRTVLAKDVRLEQCMAEHLLVYALAREPRGDDRCHAEAIAARAHGGNFQQLVRELVASEPFRLRQPEKEVSP